MKIKSLNKVENIVTKGEIAQNLAISSFATMFSNVVCCKCIKIIYKLERLKYSTPGEWIKTHIQTSSGATTTFENNMTNGEIAQSEQFLL